VKYPGFVGNFTRPIFWQGKIVVCLKNRGFFIDEMFSYQALYVNIRLDNQVIHSVKIIKQAKRALVVLAMVRGKHLILQRKPVATFSNLSFNHPLIDAGRQRNPAFRLGCFQQDVFLNDPSAFFLDRVLGLQQLQKATIEGST
jgi:hypothetical protein